MDNRRWFGEDGHGDLLASKFRVGGEIGDRKTSYGAQKREAKSSPKTSATAIGSLEPKSPDRSLNGRLRFDSF